MQSISRFQAVFSRYLNVGTIRQAPAELYAPVNYIMQLGGKRLRPVLVLMGCDLFDAQIEKALPAALAIETFHNFTLVHDDIMDAAPLRRGQPAVHQKYDENTAILSGDVMMILAYRHLCQPAYRAVLPELLDTFNRVAIEVCEGQQYDMNFETATTVKISEYLKMIELKTAVLIGGALKMGAIIGGADSDNAQKLYEFGKNIGIAFQLQDDILDTFGDPEKFGKKTGGDIAQNKKTFLLLKSLELAEGDDFARLQRLLSDQTIDETEKITAVTQLYRQLGVRALATDLMNDYLKTAFEQLHQVNVPEEKKKALKDLANELMFREV